MHRQRSAYRWSVDCSVYFRADEGGRGNGRLLYSALLPQLRDLGYHQAFAGIVLPNPASVGLHEAMGFVCIGVYEGVGYKQGGMARRRVVAARGCRVALAGGHIDGSARTAPPVPAMRTTTTTARRTRPPLPRGPGSSWTAPGTATTTTTALRPCLPCRTPRLAPT